MRRKNVSPVCTNRRIANSVLAEDTAENRTTSFLEDTWIVLRTALKRSEATGMLVGSTNTLRRQFAQPRVVRTVAFAAKALGNREKAADWLSRPNHVLGGRVPLELLATDVGARAVEEALGRIAWGGVS